MSGTPIALHKTPRAAQVDSIPGVAEPAVLEPVTGLVTGGLTVTFDNHTVQPRITATFYLFRFIFDFVSLIK